MAYRTFLQITGGHGLPVSRVYAIEATAGFPKDGPAYAVKMEANYYRVRVGTWTDNITGAFGTRREAEAFARAITKTTGRAISYSS